MAILNLDMRKLLFVFIVFISSEAYSLSLSDTTNIPEVEVSIKKIMFASASTNFDSTRLFAAAARTLSQFLQENSSVQFKTYGTSGSSVMSIRGANSSQSKVLWNGLALGSPMLNMNDVSLLNVNTTTEIKLEKGGSSATQGNGALAGYISLHTSAEFNQEKISLTTDYSSLHNQSVLLKVSKGNRFLSSQTSVNVANDKNQFNYKNYSELGSPIQAQLNSKRKQFAIIQSFYLKYKKSTIEWHQWLQESDRELSPAIYNRNRTNYQLDQSYRSIVNYNKEINLKHQFNSSISFVREKLRYISRLKLNNTDAVLFNSHSYFDQVQHQSSWKYAYNGFGHELSYQYNFDGAYVEDYFQYRKRNRFSLASSAYKKWNDFFHTSLTNRLELFNANVYYASSLVVGFTGFLRKGIYAKAHLSKNYNLPGLNDLYWIPGGNPNLKEERSLEEEFEFLYFKDINRVFLKTNVNIYHSLVSDWILWQPSAVENGIWSPQNLVEVKLQGVEISQELKWDISKKQQLTVIGFYAYSQAINNKAVNVNDQTVGKQIIYVPLEKMGLNMHYNYSSNQLSVNIHRVSHRYTTADHTSFLPAYQLIDVRISKSVAFDKHLLNCSLYIDNILNQSYESIPFQAMPARVFGGSITYQFIKQKTKKQ